MAIIAAFQNNATPYPVYGLPWTVIFPLLDADGDPVTGATCDSEINKDGDTAIDCTNEGTEIVFDTATNKGMYYLTLTAAEMTASIVTITVYSATSKATPIVLYPKILTVLSDYEAAGGAAGTITLAGSVSAQHHYYNGCIVYLNADTGAGQVRRITAYNGSSKVASVTPNWGTAPDDTTDYIIYATEESGVAHASIALASYDPPTDAELNTAIALITDDLDKGTDGLGALKAILEGIDFGDMVWFDVDTGIAGTAYPIGTPTAPSDVIADVITICGTRKIRKIHVAGALTLGATMEHYSFYGERHETAADTLTLGGQDVDSSYFEGLTIAGTQGGTAFVYLRGCIINAIVDFKGLMVDCAFYTSTCSLKDASYADIEGCYSISGAVTLTVQAPTRASIKDYKGNLILTAQDGGVLKLQGFIGTLEIDAMTGGTLDVYAEGADITINSDCSAGTITLYGTGNLTDNSGAATVNNYLIDTKVDTVDTVVDALAVSLATAQDDLDNLTDGSEPAATASFDI